MMVSLFLAIQDFKTRYTYIQVLDILLYSQQSTGQCKLLISLCTGKPENACDQLIVVVWNRNHDISENAYMLTVNLLTTKKFLFLEENLKGKLRGKIIHRVRKDNTANSLCHNYTEQKTFLSTERKKSVIEFYAQYKYLLKMKMIKTLQKHQN